MQCNDNHSHSFNTNWFFFFIIQSISYFSSTRRDIQIFVCLSFVIQVSSIHNITFHCNRIQLKCSLTKINRKSLFFSKMNDFALVNFRNIFSFCMILRITNSKTKRWNFSLIWMNDIFRVRFEFVIKSIIRRFVKIFNRIFESQRRFCEMILWFATYCIWYSVQLTLELTRRCAAIFS